MEYKGLNTMSSQIGNLSNYYHWLFSMIARYLGKSLIEIGPGYGNLAEIIMQHGTVYTGVDVDKEVINFLKNKYKDAVGMNFLLVDNDRDAYYSSLESVGADTLLSMNVLEHVDNMDAHLSNILKGIKEGNVIFIVPAHKILYGKMDETAGHLRRFARNEVVSILEKHGLRKIDVFYFNSFGAIGWFINGRILKNTVQSEITGKIVTFYDTCIVPFAKFFDRIFGNFFGQSIICVMRKK